MNSEISEKDPQDWIGNFIEEKCPECGAQLLGNKIGQRQWIN